MVILGLGSNLESVFGDRFKNIDLAISALIGYGIQIKKNLVTMSLLHTLITLTLNLLISL